MRTWTVGIAAMEQKSRSKPMRNILERMMLNENPHSPTIEFETVIFGDKVILDEDVQNWPHCDFLISFFSSGFPLQKAIDYVNLRNPFCVNDLVMQKLLFDRRLVLMLLDALQVPTPPRLILSRDGGSKISKDVAEALEMLGILLPFNHDEDDKVVQLDEDTIQVGSVTMKKPFVEKPVSGEDHNVWIYYSKSQGGGVRKLFRKVANKSSEFVAGNVPLRTEGSYIYEQFMDVDNAEDVKVYTVGTDNFHAETRKSPVVDGIVRRNADGKEVRYVTTLNVEEQEIAKKVCKYFRQSVCGLDLLRVDGKSYVIDVNGWSFVKGNENYYNMAARALREAFLAHARMKKARLPREPSFENQWRLKGYLSVFRHADRTPKQKMKFFAMSAPFVDLLNGATEELLLKRPEDLKLVIMAAEQAKADEDCEVMDQLINVLQKKLNLPGTKVQIKPFFSKQDGLLERLQVVVKWGGEFTHAGRHHSQDLGENLRKDIMLVNKELLDNVDVYSSSERRVIATTDVFLKAFLAVQEVPRDMVSIRKDMLDDSYDAKEQMELVKSKLQKSLNPANAADTDSSLALVARELIDLLQSRREIMHKKFDSEAIDTLKQSWCCNESSSLFRERWDRLFKDICDVERSLFDPSKVPELYDSLKYDALHNGDFIDKVFVDQNAPGDPREPLRQMYHKAKLLFDFIAPCEYGITREEKLEIGMLTSFVLLKQIVGDLNRVRDSDVPRTMFYFTKESHVHTLYNVIRLCLSPQIPEVAELDYLTQITFEMYERRSIEESSLEYSVRIGFSPGAHDSGLIDTQMDYKHALAVAPRVWLTDHLPLGEAISKLLPYLSTPRTSPRCSPKLQMRNRRLENLSN